VNVANSSSGARPFSITIYLIIVFGVSWPLQLIPLVWEFQWMVVIAGTFAAMLMLVVGTYVAARYVFRDGLSYAGWTWGRLRHYLVVILLALFLWCVPILADISFGTKTKPDLLELNRLSLTFLVIFPLTIVASFCEEFAWRGYLLPRLAQRWPAGIAVLVHAVVWCVWRLPIMGVPIAIVGRELARISGLPADFTIPWVAGVAVVAGVLHGVVFAYFWSISGSLLVVTLYHALHDSLRDATWLTIDHGIITQWWALAAISVLGAVLLWKSNWSGLISAAESLGSDDLEPEAGPKGP
jgi:membrane protease YdiL (CAAX protease family)